MLEACLWCVDKDLRREKLDVAVLMLVMAMLRFRR